MMKKFYLILSIFLSSLFAQTFTGIITDTSGEPLQYVFVKQGENITTSNRNGSFTIDIENDNPMMFSLIGFETLEVNIQNIVERVFVLQNKNIELQSVEVYGNSKNYLKYSTFNLDDKNKISILIPPMFLNSWLCLSKNCIYSYDYYFKGNYNDVKNQISIKWNDAKINFKWPIKKPILSFRDRQG